MAEEVSRLRAIFEADPSGFNSALDSVQGGIGKAVGALAGLAGAIGVSFAAGDSIQRALEFDKALSNIRSVTGDTAQETAALGEMLKNTAMNSAIPDGLNAISGAYYDIVGGVSDASARQDIFNSAIATAEAGQANLGAVTSGLISAVNAYGSANLTAAYASDILTRTVGMGVGSMDQFVAAMGPISGVMASAGVKFQDMGAAMAFMTTKGASASQAATRMQAATVALINPNKEMEALLKKIGAASGTAAIEQYGLAGTLDKLKEAAGGSVEDMSKALGSVEALGAASALTADDFKGFSDTFIDGAEGATDAARKLQLDSVSAQFETFKNTLSGIGLSIGQAFLPALNTLLGGFNAFMGDVQKLGLGGALEKWWNAGVEWLTTNGPGLLQTALQTALDIGQDIVTFVQTYGPNIVAGAIGLWEDLKAWFESTGAGLFADALKAGLKLGQDVAAFVINNAPDIVFGIETWVGDAWLWLQNNVGPKLGEALRIGFGLLGDLVTLIRDNAPDIGHAVGTWINSAFTGLGKIIHDALATAFSTPIDTTGLQGGDIAADLFSLPEPSVFQEMAQSVMDIMTNIFSTGIGLIGGLFEGLFGLKEGTIKGFFDNFIGPNGPLTKFKVEIEKIWNSIFGENGALRSAINTLSTFVGGVFEALKSTVMSILKPLLQPLATLMKAVSLAFYALGDTEHAAAAANAALAIDGMFAAGGQAQAGGMYLVGEKGPEILKMGNTSGEVIPNNRLNSVVGGGGGATLNISGLVINGVQNAEQFFDELQAEARRRGLELAY